MLEGLIVRCLQTYIGMYLDDFDASNLNISVLKGKIHLTNLKINNKLLDNIPFPLKMKYGRIGKIEIEVPSLLHFNKARITVRVSDVFICFT